MCYASHNYRGCRYLSFLTIFTEILSHDKQHHPVHGLSGVVFISCSSTYQEHQRSKSAGLMCHYHQMIS